MSNKPPGDPRNGHRYRTAVAELRARTDLCWICGHRGARTLDHLITVKMWGAMFDTYDGINDPENTDIAHGTGNECPECGRRCNQERGDGTRDPQPRSRDW